MCCDLKPVPGLGPTFWRFRFPSWRNIRAGDDRHGRQGRPEVRGRESGRRPEGRQYPFCHHGSCHEATKQNDILYLLTIIIHVFSKSRVISNIETQEIPQEVHALPSTFSWISERGYLLRLRSVLQQQHQQQSRRRRRRRRRRQQHKQRHQQQHHHHRHHYHQLRITTTSTSICRHTRQSQQKQHQKQ